jgi:hypothetical protein
LRHRIPAEQCEVSTCRLLLDGWNSLAPPISFDITIGYGHDVYYFTWKTFLKQTQSGQSGEWKIEKWGGRPCPPAGEAGIDILIKGSGTALAAAGGIAGRDARATDIHQ